MGHGSRAPGTLSEPPRSLYSRPNCRVVTICKSFWEVSHFSSRERAGFKKFRPSCWLDFLLSLLISLYGDDQQSVKLILSGSNMRFGA